QNQLHRAIIDQDMIQGDIGKLGRHLDDHLAPELRIFEHIRLVDAGDLLAPVARQLESHAAHSLYFGARVDHRVDGARFRAVLENTSRGAVVDTAVELPDN